MRRRLIRPALFASALAAMCVFAACQADVREPPAAASPQPDQQLPAPPIEAPAEPLTLILDPPAVCETTTPYEAVDIDMGVVDDDEEPRYREGTISDSWWEGPTEVEVSWTITGGAAPYTLTLDDETFTAEPTGKALVSCALRTGPTSRDEIFGTRRYNSKPLVDSGVKTIAAAVVDAYGTRIEATATMDVIIDIEGSDIGVLEGGKTYRVFGTLMTIPKGINMQVGGWISMECEEGDRSPLCGETYYLEIVGANPVRVAQIRLRPGLDRELGRRVDIRPSLGVMGAEPPSEQLTSEEEEAFTNLANSLGRWPSGEEER